MDFLAYIFLALAVWQWLRKRHYRKLWQVEVKFNSQVSDANRQLSDCIDKHIRARFGRSQTEDEWPEVIEK